MLYHRVRSCTTAETLQTSSGGSGGNLCFWPEATAGQFLGGKPFFLPEANCGGVQDHVEDDEDEASQRQSIVDELKDIIGRSDVMEDLLQLDMIAQAAKHM